MDTTIFLYIAIMGLGILIGSKKLSPEKEYKWLSQLQFVALMVLITALGIQIGSNKQVVASLSEIGLSAFIVTMFCMAGSVLCLFVLRKWMRIDKKGVRRDD